MSELGRLLRRARAHRGSTLRQVAQESGKFSPQSLSAYERGVSLPSPDALGVLARSYGEAPEGVERAYAIDASRAATGPVAQAPFLASLEALREGDHLVVVTQNPITGTEPHYADDVLKLLKRGASLTYVAAVVKGDNASPFRDSTDIWESNHRAGASVLSAAFSARAANVNQLPGKLGYLLITNPIAYDFAFLRAEGAWVYLSRRSGTEEADDEQPDSEIWAEMRGPGGEHWWQPCHTGLLYKLHNWIVDGCGLRLPSTEFRAPKKLGTRHVRSLSFEEFLANG